MLNLPTPGTVPVCLFASSLLNVTATLSQCIAQGNLRPLQQHFRPSVDALPGQQLELHIDMDQVPACILGLLKGLSHSPDIRITSVRTLFRRTVEQLLPEPLKTPTLHQVDALFAQILATKSRTQLREERLETIQAEFTPSPQERLEAKVHGLSGEARADRLHDLLTKLYLERLIYNLAVVEAPWNLESIRVREDIFRRYTPISGTQFFVPIPETVSAKHLSTIICLIAGWNRLSRQTQENAADSQKVAGLLNTFNDRLAMVRRGAPDALTSAFEQIRACSHADFLHHHHAVFGRDRLLQLCQVVRQRLTCDFESLTLYLTIVREIFDDRAALGTGRGSSFPPTLGNPHIEAIKASMDPRETDELLTWNGVYRTHSAAQEALYRLTKEALWETTEQGRRRVKDRESYSRRRFPIVHDETPPLTFPDQLPSLATPPPPLAQAFDRWLSQELANAAASADKSEFLPAHLRQPGTSKPPRVVQPGRKGKQRPVRPPEAPSPTIVEASGNGESSPLPSKQLLGRIPDCLYAERIMRWFGGDEVGRFESYTDLSDTDWRQQRLYHGFSPRVDPLLHELGVKSAWVNRTTGKEDQQFFIPAQFGEVRGSICYCIGFDRKGRRVLYHRYFQPMTTQKLIETFGYQVFPQTPIDRSLPGEAVSSQGPSQGNLEYTEEHGMVTIHDPRFGIDIILFRPVFTTERS